MNQLQSLACKTCGDETLVIAALPAGVREFHWVVACSQGHRVIPVAGWMISIQTKEK